MQLREIQLRAWRGLDQTLGRFSPRLNLILGPNESGKSRIFQALQFALFESCKGTAQRKLALQSWSSTDAPFVRVVFAEGGVEYELQKQFLKGATVQLAGGGRTLRAEEAEESLRNLLGAKAAGSRGIETANLGIWPLLMVAQGDSRQPIQDHLNEDGRGRLHERLSQEIGVAAISASGQRIMALAEQEFARFFTATGQDGKSLRDARAQFRAAETMLADAAAALKRQERTALDLAQNRQELLELEARRTRAKHEADAAQDRAEAAQAVGRLVATAQGILNTAVQRAANGKDALAARREVDDTLERLRSDLERLEADLAQRSRLQSELERAAHTAEKQFADAGRRANESRLALESLQRQRRHEELTNTATELMTRIAGLEQIEASIAAARSQRAALPLVDDAGLARLKNLDQNVRAASAKLQGAAVSIVVHLRQDAVVDGTRHSAGDAIQIHVVENRRIALGDLADVEIRPGGGELERLRAAATAADRELKTALQQAGAGSFDAAAHINVERNRCEQQIAELGKQARATSAKPLAQLREELAACSAELERLGPASGVVRDETALRAAQGTAEASLVQATGERDSSLAALGEFRNETSGLRARIDALRGERDRQVSLYAGRPTSEQLQVALEESIAERERCTAALAEAKREFVDLGGSEIQADARRLGIAADALANRTRDVRSAGDQLQGELRTLMLGGHYESTADAGAKFEQAQADLQRIERQAAAAGRLWEVLGAERRRVIERLIAPVTSRVKPYLQDLFPGCVLDAGESLDVVGLQSAQLSEPFAELSGGAQEQISLLTRIGIAEVLAADDTLPLVLDDALVNTDPERIRRIQRLLFRAADNLQIILFSCHDVLFDGLGAEFVHQLQRRRH